jgi:hypothetical protein
MIRRKNDASYTIISGAGTSNPVVGKRYKFQELVDVDLSQEDIDKILAMLPKKRLWKSYD